MNAPKIRKRQCGVILLFFATTIWLAAFGQSKTSFTRLEVAGDVVKSVSLSLDDLRHMPRKTVSIMNENQGKDEIYEGVSVTALLKEAGVPQGARLRGRAMATYILAEGSDGYRVTFSVAELDSDFQDSQIIVADTFNGAPLGDKLGPLRLVAPHDKRPARWVRMLRLVKVVNVP